MSLSLTIFPLSDELFMYGELDSACAYSLSGHISISVSSPLSLFETRRTARLLLQSLSLTFEGQSEIYTPSTGYSSLRLCSVTRELISSAHLELSNEGHEDVEPCVWNIIFNLPIPGWLPETTTLGIEGLGVRYALYATAKFTNIIDEEQHTAWGFTSLCAPFWSRVRTAEAIKSVTLRRFIAVPKAEITDMSFTNYLVNSTSIPSREQLDKARIPSEVLSCIQVLVSLPEYVDMTENAIPLTLRLRAKDLSEEQCSRIQLTELTVDVFQQEKCRYRPSVSFLSRFPLPAKDMQPPQFPLRNPHPFSYLYDVGLYVPEELSEAVCRTFSLLPPDEDGRYELLPNNYIFAHNNDKDETHPWYTMDTSVPFIHRNTSVNMGESYDASIEWAGEKDLRPTSNSPLYTVIHDLIISLTFTYDLKEGEAEVARDRLSFKVPLTFTQVVPKLSVNSVRCLGTLQGPRVGTLHEDIRRSSLNLPAYSQLYDSNGERKIDYTIPLPVYSPRPSTPPSISDTLLIDQLPSSSERSYLGEQGENHRVQQSLEQVKIQQSY